MPLGGTSAHLAPMPFLMPVVAILIPGLLGTLFFGLLIRFSRKPATVFLSVSLAALILSFGGPFNLPDASIQTKLLLSGMQVIAAGIITGGILLMSHKTHRLFHLNINKKNRVHDASRHSPYLFLLRRRWDLRKPA